MLIQAKVPCSIEASQFPHTAWENGDETPREDEANKRQTAGINRKMIASQLPHMKQKNGSSSAMAWKKRSVHTFRSIVEFAAHTTEKKLKNWLHRFCHCVRSERIFDRFSIRPLLSALNWLPAKKDFRISLNQMHLYQFVSRSMWCSCSTALVLLGQDSRDVRQIKIHSTCSSAIVAHCQCFRRRQVVVLCAAFLHCSNAIVQQNISRLVGEEDKYDNASQTEWNRKMRTSWPAHFIFIAGICYIVRAPFRMHDAPKYLEIIVKHAKAINSE